MWRFSRNISCSICKHRPAFLLAALIKPRMSVIFERDSCKLITHDRQLHCYKDDSEGITKYQLNETLFNNFKRKQKVKSTDEVNEMKAQVESFLKACKGENIFRSTDPDKQYELKQKNIELMNRLYAIPSDLGFFHGENNLNYGKMTTANEQIYLIPPHCKFFNKKVEELESFLPSNEVNKFDFIVLDPPWTNRYIKRVKKQTDNKQGYAMMSDDEISQIPLENYIKQSSIVVIWCTNSEAHINSIKDKLLVKWKLKLLSTWQWVKVDKHGELFTTIDGNKKPFEQIFIATHQNNKNYDKEFDDCLIFSQPSSIHSHKPPLFGELHSVTLTAQP